MPDDQVDGAYNFAAQARAAGATWEQVGQGCAEYLCRRA